MVRKRLQETESAKVNKNMDRTLPLTRREHYLEGSWKSSSLEDGAIQHNKDTRGEMGQNNESSLEHFKFEGSLRHSSRGC